ncbi:MAG: hypothetical protein JWO80_1608 [Bryobacterales bacterium]|nr:hypothetical protein [Bryobacterales bacterium]
MATLVSLLSLLPVILAAVQAVEAALPLPGAGKAKLDLVLGTVSDIYAADQQIQKQIPGDQLVSVVTSTVSHVVSCFNALGLFKKSK